MIRYCLDTSAYSQFKRGHADAVAHIDSAAWIGVPVVVLGELWLGFGLGDRSRRNARELATFLEHPVVETLGVDAETARIFGRLGGALRRRGTPIPTNDIWIAALAAQHKVPVLTYDSHFRGVTDIASVILKA